MNQPNMLSDIEWKIMKAVWDKGEAPVKEIWQIAFPEQEKAYTTIQTYMDRMVDKGLLKKRKLGLVNFYTAQMEESTLTKKATDNLAKRVFDGKVGRLAAFLMKSYDISDKELEEIKKLINEKEKEQ